MFIDSHAHLTIHPDTAAVAELLSRAQQKQVSGIVNICTRQEELERGLFLETTHPWISNAAAAPPHDITVEEDLFFPIVSEKAFDGTLIAIGETGLDYHYYRHSMERQKESLIRYCRLSIETGLPMIFHCREAFSDLFALTDCHYKDRPAVIHCFTGTLKEAEEALARGWYLSISGIVTFDRSAELRTVISHIPLERILIETDSPYLAPQSRRGEKNEPSYIDETARKVAEIKALSVADLAKATTENAFRFFSFPKHLLSI